MTWRLDTIRIRRINCSSCFSLLKAWRSILFMESCVSLSLAPVFCAPIRTEAESADSCWIFAHVGRSLSIRADQTAPTQSWWSRAASCLTITNTYCSFILQYWMLQRNVIQHHSLAGKDVTVAHLKARYLFTAAASCENTSSQTQVLNNRLIDGNSLNPSCGLQLRHLGQLSVCVCVENLC